jgi:PAS domain S-box-containing protein
LEGQEFKTKNFRETIWKQVSEIIVHGEQIGTFEVCYLEERAESDEGPFLKEERSLINAIAERLGKIIVRKLAEEALRESEERYRNLAEKLADGVGITQDGRLVYVNDALCSVLGNTSNQLLGTNPVTVFGDKYKEHFRAPLSVIEKGDFVGYWQGMCLGRDGQELWIETHRNLIKWEGKPAILFAIRDITEAHNREITITEEVEHLRKENIRLKSTIKERYKFGEIIGKSPAMQEVYELILKAAATNAPVAIYGESGTGKELVARAIHEMGDRCKRGFVAVNCGAIPENLLESEFFGHKRGAFTGAQIDKNGFLDIADGGVLFLDEVGELCLTMQVKLLRAIDGGGYRPVGGTKTKDADFRIISATNKNLRDLVNGGFMRDDFFYRLQVIPITLPPLREHKEDIPLLVDHFLQLNDNGEKRSISSKIMEAFMGYDWPGNIRELQNVLHRYLAVKRLDFIDMPRSRIVAPDNGSTEEFGLEGLEFHTAVEGFEKDLILKALECSQWHKAKAASMLSLPRRTFFRKLKYFGLIESHSEPYLDQS